MTKFVALFVLLALGACGGGGLDLNGPVNLNFASGSINVDPGAVTCTGCTIPITVPGAEPAASAASAP